MQVPETVESRQTVRDSDAESSGTEKSSSMLISQSSQVYLRTPLQERPTLANTADRSPDMINKVELQFAELLNSVKQNR
jgi:hypothetical protein